jgi:DUF438 domain-containing protein
MQRLANITVALVLATKAQWASQARERELRKEKDMALRQAMVYKQRIQTAEEDQARLSQQMTELLSALENQLAKLRTDHVQEKEQLLESAAQERERERRTTIVEKDALKSELEVKQDLVARVERDRQELASKMEQAMQAVSAACALYASGRAVVSVVVHRGVRH